MGLVALEEIVMGSRTRQRLLCAGVKQPQSPTWNLGPRQTAGGRWSRWPELGYRLQGTEEPPGPDRSTGGCDVSLL